MRTYFECIPCFIRQTVDAMKMITDDVSIHEKVIREVLREASALVGTPHHLSVHPGGVVIGPGALTELLPVQWSPVAARAGLRIAQFDHVDVEALGLPKLDLLGIRALSVLADAAELVRRDRDPTFRLSTITSGDRATEALLLRADTVGVFQCESSGMRATMVKLRARTPYDLAVTNAFFKPGPSLGGMAGAFVRRYRGSSRCTISILRWSRSSPRPKGC
jgi:DNA polymerase III alpha subunit